MRGNPERPRERAVPSTRARHGFGRPFRLPAPPSSGSSPPQPPPAARPARPRGRAAPETGFSSGVGTNAGRLRLSNRPCPDACFFLSSCSPWFSAPLLRNGSTSRPAHIANSEGDRRHDRIRGGRGRESRCAHAGPGRPAHAGRAEAGPAAVMDVFRPDGVPPLPPCPARCRWPDSWHRRRWPRWWRRRPTGTCADRCRGRRR